MITYTALRNDVGIALFSDYLLLKRAHEIAAKTGRRASLRFLRGRMSRGQPVPFVPDLWGSRNSWFADTAQAKSATESRNPGWFRPRGTRIRAVWIQTGKTHQCWSSSLGARNGRIATPR